MPPKAKILAMKKLTPKAKAKARLARQVQVNLKARKKRKAENSRCRKDAIVELNELTLAIGLNVAPLLMLAPKEDVEKRVRLLENRCQDSTQAERLRAAAESYVKAGGQFQRNLVQAPEAPTEAPGDLLLDDDDTDLSVVVLNHRVLESGFILKSKAFMTTFNGPSIAPDTFDRFVAWMGELKTRLGFQAWAACVERTPKPSATSKGDVYHLHAYQ